MRGRPASCPAWRKPRFEIRRGACRKKSCSWCRVHLIPVTRNAENYIEKRYEYCSTYLVLNDDTVVFLYKFEVSYSIRQKYGKSLRNKTPRKQVWSIRSKIMSVLPAINKKGIISCIMQESAFNQITFKDYIENLMQHISCFPEYKPGLVLKKILKNCGRAFK